VTEDDWSPLDSQRLRRPITQLDFQHLASVYDQTHPRAKRKGSTE
jgi:hypothetical protein